MEGESFFNYLLIAVGILSIFAAFFNWAWLFKRQRKAGFIKLLDQNGARVFNFMLGLLSLLVGSFDYIFPNIK